MSLVIIAIFVLIAVVMLCFAIDQVPQFAPYNGLIKFVIVILGVLFLLSKAGVV
jgi:hypothetical protein